MTLLFCSASVPVKFLRNASMLMTRICRVLLVANCRSRIIYLNVVARLHGAGVGEQFVLGKEQLVARAQLGLLLPGEERRSGAYVDDGVLRRASRLTVEQVRDRRHGVELERLVGVKL